MSKESRILHREMKNSLNLPTINGMTLMNASGDIDPSSAGFQYMIQTLSYIRSRVIDQKFYEIPIADYVPVDVGEAAWSEEIVQNLTFDISGSFFDGDIDTMSGNGRITEVNAALAPIRMPVTTWAKATSWTIMEIAKAAAASNWDVVESKLKTLKKNWDLGIQEVAFLGHPSRATQTGLLNDSQVTSNTTLITTDISGMNESAFQTFITGLLNSYWTNSNDTALPDTFIIPTDDYLGLGSAASATYPNITKLEYLQNSLKKMSRNEGFQILPLAYSQTERNSLGVDRYVLYRNDPETLAMSIPVDFTMLEADTSNKIMWQQAAYGQYSGVLVNRKREVLYFDK